MNVVEIDEVVQVLALFRHGEMRPLRFLWQKRGFRVEKVNGSWREREGDNFTLHFSVQVGSETYFLQFSSRAMQWRLEQMVLDS